MGERDGANDEPGKKPEFDFSTLGQRNTDEDDIVYHYCDLHAAISILQNRQLWATHLHYVNDFSEINFGLTEIYTAIDALRAEFRGDKLAGEFLDSCEEAVKDNARWHFFACCFSMEGDLLSQWRAYANDGFGVALGFSKADLSKCSVAGYESDPPLEISVQEVIYGPGPIREVLQEELQKLRSAGVPGSDEDRTWIAGNHGQYTVGLLLQRCASHKSPAFVEEREYRLCATAIDFGSSDEADHLVRFPSDQRYAIDGISLMEIANRLEEEKSLCQRYRVSRFGITPYVEVAFSHHCLKRVVFGPRCSFGRQMAAMQMMLKSFGYREGAVETDRSEATYQ